MKRVATGARLQAGDREALSEYQRKLEEREAKVKGESRPDDGAYARKA